MVSGVFAETAMVVTLKVTEADPAGTVTLTGTKAAVPVVHSSTAMPPAGAAAVRVTVPVGEVPPLMLVGVTETEDRATLVAGVTVSDAVLLTPL